MQLAITQTYRVPCLVTYRGYAVVEAANPEHAKEVTAVDPCVLFECDGQERVEVIAGDVEVSE